MTIYDYLFLYFSLGACFATGLMLACAPRRPTTRGMVQSFAAWPLEVADFVRLLVKHARRSSP